MADMDDEIRARFWNSLAVSPCLMLGLHEDGGHSEPMLAQLDPGARDTVWFFTSRDNRVAGGGRAMAQFAGKGHDVFACLSGTLVEEHDPQVVDRHWSDAVGTWFPGGKDDPQLVMLRFEIDDAEVWTADMETGGQALGRV